MKDMLGREAIMKADKALERFISQMQARRHEIVVKTENALGMVCSEAIIAPEDLPHFSRSTVDGYAVKSADTFGASEGMPAYLELIKEVSMGVRPDVALSKGKASPIPTGGMLPDGADAVVMFEHVQVIDASMIEVLRPAAPGEHVIQKGEDVKKGETVIAKGHRMRPHDIGACAGLGITEITVFRRPEVSIISTGDEILPAESVPSLGQVRDINSYVLAGLVQEAGGVPIKKGIFKDEYQAIRTVLEDALAASDMILISGGTSVGTKDMIAQVIRDIDKPGVIFHGVSLKPGKPLIGGIVKGVPVFGLPGHPAAVSICFEIFIQPVMEILSGFQGSSLFSRIPSVKARLTKNISSSPGREEHVRVILEERDNEIWAIPVYGKSGLITTLVRADGTVLVPLNCNGIEQDEVVDVRLF
jgi:molybdopterin molybdotransferase